MTRRAITLVFSFSLLMSPSLRSADPLHKQIDALVSAAGKGKPISAISDDAEFLRRVTLDLAGRIPSAQEARAFLQDNSADKREKLLDRLLASPDYPRRMQEQFNIVLMERLGDSADWSKYLLASFEKNKPWDVMAREMLSASRDESAKGASFFLSKRLENYGQNPVDYPALTRDLGRLFLGVNLQCAQCHDHLFISDYKQVDFQGLFAFVQNVALDKSGVIEKPTTKKVAFASVFEKIQKETGPRLPGMKEVSLPKPGDEWLTKPDPKTKTVGVLKFSTLAKLAESVADPGNQAFSRNFANRLWFMMMGRGLVHPLDMSHSDNPPSHPEVLDLLAKEAVARKYDVKALLRELALSQTYQRSSVLPSGATKIEPVTFLTAHEKRLSSEQLLASVLEATGEKERINKAKGGVEALRAKFLKAFANTAREPEEDFAPSLKSALFLLNDSAVLDLLTPRPGNLIDRASKLADDKVAEELYLSILCRLPSAEEKDEITKHLAKNAKRKTIAVGHLAWALLASTEFCVNH
jgi:hypothetical protein